MRIALVSDLHANLEALKVLDRALSALSPERVYHLGDLVGCGAHPGECVRWAVANTRGGVLGNHDAVALNRLGGMLQRPPTTRPAGPGSGCPRRPGSTFPSFPCGRG